jgi:hypothetical protein
MKRTLRQVLADSHVAAVAIAVLLLATLDATFRGLWDAVYRVGVFLFTAIAIWDIPYISPRPTAADRLMPISTFYFLYSAIASLSGAWGLSRWVYGTGPLRSLIACGAKLRARRDA